MSIVGYSRGLIEKNQTFFKKMISGESWVSLLSSFTSTGIMKNSDTPIFGGG